METPTTSARRATDPMTGALRPPCADSTLARAANFVVHLRLPFQLTLAPFMLWGAAISHARVDPRFALAFVVVQVCLYGGTTAFNSHYDRDEGPVGGLEHPPPAGPWLLPGSLVLQAIGLVFAWAIGGVFLATCAAYAVLGALYSHPRTRWKGRPWASWAVVALGQGALATLAGIALASPARATPEIAWGVAAAGALVGALFPLTQIYQVSEDRARGDRTTAMALGARGTRAASIALSVAGAVCAAESARAGGHPFDAAVLASAALPMVAGAAWATAPLADTRALYRRVTLVQIGAGAAFGAYAALRLLLTPGCS